MTTEEREKRREYLTDTPGGREEVREELTNYKTDSIVVEVCDWWMKHCVFPNAPPHENQSVATRMLAIVGRVIDDLAQTPTPPAPAMDPEHREDWKA